MAHTVVYSVCSLCCRGQTVTVYWAAPSPLRDEGLRSAVRTDESTIESLLITSANAPLKIMSGKNYLHVNLALYRTTYGTFVNPCVSCITSATLAYNVEIVV